MEKSVPEPHFYTLSTRLDDVSDSAAAASAEVTGQVLEALPTTAGPWSAEAQHGGPPAGLLVRAVERLPEAEHRVVGRVTMEFWGSIPVGPVRSVARVVRPGRSVVLAESQLFDHARDRLVASASVWLFPRSEGGPATIGPALSHTPDDGRVGGRPRGWGAGYLDAVEWRWIDGRLGEPGVGAAWMRAPRLVAGEETSPVQRLMSCVDSASGVGAALDIREWQFLNTELSVHVLREPVGPWVCLIAETTLGPGSVAIATSVVHDQLGPVARSAQALLVSRR